MMLEFGDAQTRLLPKKKVPFLAAESGETLVPLSSEDLDEETMEFSGATSQPRIVMDSVCKGNQSHTRAEKKRRLLYP